MTTSIRTAALALVSLLVFACGPSAKEKTIRTTLTTVNAARAAFVAWDGAVQDRIIEHATDESDGHAQLERHRDRRDELVTLFEATYMAIAVAATDVSDQNVADMLAAAALLYNAYKGLVGDDPPTGGAR